MSSTVDAMQRIDISVVIPCLNEANSVGVCVDKARRAFADHGLYGEVIVADNGSTDGSREIAKQHGALVVPVEDRGYGAALRGGIRVCRSKWIVMGDADDSYDFGQVPDFVAKLQEGYDVVMGNRFQGGIKPGAMPWHHRYIGNPVLAGLLNLFFRAGIGDSHCGMRGFTREVFERMDLRCRGMEFASEFVIKAAQLDARMTEVPVVLWPDKRGRPPHLRSFRDGWRHLRFMLLYAPNWVFLFPGTLLMVLGLATVFWLLPGPRRLPSGVVIDVQTMILGVIATLIGAQIVTIGFFAKVFSYSERFDRGSVSLRRMLRYVTLETGLLVGGAVFVAGLTGSAVYTWRWMQSGFGPFPHLRAVVVWSTLLFLGVQAIYSSIFLSMLGISRDTYIGDYDIKR